jgi:hypothetical protein
MRIRHFIARVRRAYGRIGMRPIRGYFLRRRTRHCCPLTALYLAETGKPFHRESVLARADEEFGKDWRIAFVNAFDNRAWDSDPGRRCGVAVAKALFPH